MWLSSIGGMLISYVIFTVLSAVYARTGNAAAGQASVAFIFTFNAGKYLKLLYQAFLLICPTHADLLPHTAYALAGTALAYVRAGLPSRTESSAHTLVASIEQTYALELLPQRLRTKGIAISNFVDQLAAVFNQVRHHARALFEL